MWLESSTSAGGAAPPTPGETDTSKRDVLAKGTAAIDDGSSITLGQKSFARVNSPTSATWTNTGANTLNCAAKDSSLLGDNSLYVDLGYTFTP